MTRMSGFLRDDYSSPGRIVSRGVGPFVAKASTSASPDHEGPGRSPALPIGSRASYLCEPIHSDVDLQPVPGPSREDERDELSRRSVPLGRRGRRWWRLDVEGEPVNPFPHDIAVSVVGKLTRLRAFDRTSPWGPSAS